jgi:hypothetical protein
LRLPGNGFPLPTTTTRRFVENPETAIQSDTLPEVLRCAQDDRTCEIVTESTESKDLSSLQSSLPEFPLAFL